MFEKAEKLIAALREGIQYIKRGRREQRLAFVVVACFSLAAILVAPESWLPFLQPLKKLIEPHFNLIASILAGTGVIVLLFLIRMIYRQASPPEAPIEKPTPSVIKGPLSFGPQDGKFFQGLGRKDELDKILGYVKDPQIPLIVVMGESGAGKTSLLRSGLDYCCKQENISAVYWEAVPGKPVDGLIETVNRFWNHKPDEQGASLKTLNELIDAASQRDAVIILDQFEQLDPDDDEAKRIFKAMVEICFRPAPHRTTWIVAFRRDYDPDWRDFELENPRLKSAMLSVKLFIDAQARSVMVAIAKEAGFTLDESLLKDLLDSFRSNGKISPVDIGISMLALNNLAKSREEKHLTVDDYRIAGGSIGVLTSYLSEQLERLREEDRKELSKILLRLVDLKKNKRIAEGKTLSELIKESSMPARLVEAELDRLSSPSVRLLESFTGAQGEKSYRLPHERIISSLKQLSGDVLAEVEQARIALEQSFEIWDAKRKSKYLLSGRELKKVLKHAEQLDWGERADEKQTFIQRSRARRTKTRLTATVMLLIFSLLSYTGVRRYEAYQQRRDLTQWGLPADLYEYQHQLDSLSVIHDQLTNTAWIKADLKELSIGSEGLRNLDSLPSSITSLDLSETGITSLAGIEKLTNLTTLDLSDTGITSLAGIEKLTNLTTLDLSNNRQLTSLAGMENLKSLTTLDLSNNRQLTSLTGIEKLTNLTTLDLSNQKLTNLAGIEKLTNLTTLDLSNTGITSLAGMEKLTNLTTLDLSDTGITSLAGIEKLTNLTTLDLSGNEELTSLAGIENLTNLTTLKLNKNLTNLTTLKLNKNQQPMSLARIEKLTNLTTLDLGDTEVTSLAGIEKLTNLTTLNLSDSRQRTSLAGIEKLTNLTTLNLSYNRQRTSLAGIEKLTNLTTLNLSDNRQLTSLAEIEKLTNLTTLDLSDTGITSLAGMERLTNLTTLDLSNNRQLTSLAGMENLTNPTTLDLSGNKELTSLAGIEKLTNLTTLDLSFTGITSLAGIEKLTNLTTLKLSFTGITSLVGLEKCKKLAALEIYGLNLITLKGLPGSIRKLGLGTKLLITVKIF